MDDTEDTIVVLLGTMEALDVENNLLHETVDVLQETMDLLQGTVDVLANTVKALQNTTNEVETNLQGNYLRGATGTSLGRERQHKRRRQQHLFRFSENNYEIRENI